MIITKVKSRRIAYHSFNIQQSQVKFWYELGKHKINKPQLQLLKEYAIEYTQNMVKQGFYGGDLHYNDYWGYWQIDTK